jgi:hypothetical protein
MTVWMRYTPEHETGILQISSSSQQLKKDPAEVVDP